MSTPPYFQPIGNSGNGMPSGTGADPHNQRSNTTTNYNINNDNTIMRSAGNTSMVDSSERTAGTTASQTTTGNQSVMSNVSATMGGVGESSGGGGGAGAAVVGTGGGSSLEDSANAKATASAESAGGAGAGTATSNTNAPSTATDSAAIQPTDQAVLEYLRQRGMAAAVLELQEKLKQTHDQSSSLDTNTKESNQITTPTVERTSLKEQLEQEDAVARNQRTILTKATGGGFGYDRDAAAPIVQWGVPDTIAPTGKDGQPLAKQLGVDEARCYLDAFCALQIWVLSLPDDHFGSNIQPRTHNVIQKAQELLQTDKTVSLSTLVKEMTHPSTSTSSSGKEIMFQLPPSAKPELLTVTFALLVHTYCELLEVGMETTAHVLRDAFEPVYAPLYGNEYRDLHLCSTTEHIVRLNAHNSQHMEALASLKQILLQVAQFQFKKEEMMNQLQIHANSTDQHAQAARKAKIQEYEQTINLLQQRYNERSQNASTAFDRMHDLPFLRRARAVRWQLTLSTATYGLLAQFLSSSTMPKSLLAMSTLLQTKCELHVEPRDPLPFTPACVFDESKGELAQLNEQIHINWAAPVPLQHEGSTNDNDLPFPRYHLLEEYDDERSARKDKQAVEFNRSMLINGFRRLEALERKRDYQVMKNGDSEWDPQQRVLANPLEPSILLSTLCANSNTARKNGGPTITSGLVADLSSIWDESGIGLTCAKLCPPDGRRVAVGCDDSAIRIWDLMSHGTIQGDGSMGDAQQVLLGHKNGFPVFDVDWNRDGRSLLSAGGDGSVRLWDTMAQGPFGLVGKPTNKPSSTTTTSASSKKNPTSVSEKVTAAQAKEQLDKATKALEQAVSNPDMDVPGLKPETNAYTSGAALAVYRGHVPNTPVWSVAFAPCGYYFASAGADATARLWTTDRPSPVRLFAGHTSNSVNSVVFHPNCNYILTGGEDKTARLWDIQTGRCVRLLTGCGTGINVVKVSPDGRHAAGADYSGIIHLWDLASGKKVTEFRPKKMDNIHDMNMIHSLSFSACGTALAAGGDDCCVRVWDVRKTTAIEHTPLVDTPSKIFPTRRTMIMDLYYTKRNLLLSMGKYITAVPQAIPITD